MCLIAWRTAPTSPWPLLLAANRDEFHAREALPLHRWSGARHLIIAGKDLVGGGTWLGLAVTRRGLRLAMLTNVRNGRAPAAGRCLAERVVRGRVESVDVSPLAFERFAKGALVHETMVL